MRAIEISRPGGPEVLTLTDRPLPEPGPGEVRLRLGYAGVNRPDALQRAGGYAPPPGASDLPGLEGAGWVDALGPGVTDVALGDPVCALLPGGGYADYALAPAAHCLPVPPGLSLAQAAALPETFFTVWSNVFQRGGLKGGERFLVHGGASGIGTTAIQLAHALGARVWATAGGPDRARACESLGAERGIDRHTEDFVEILRAEGGADVILDMVGGPYLPRNLKALADDGRLVQIAFLQGPKSEIDLNQVMRRRLTITGSTLRPQSVAQKAAIAESLRREVWPLLASGRVRPVMDAEFPLEQAAEAHRRLESNGVVGKIVLRIA
ncbi:NAD(P)H-quinone oxidoreductase [Rubellimicrobium aerolatum]|uniref:NAD(P)H-quinone oxidoreductase n=1 Tax=Rubellimicrobium aerolatum TaxID=490979 RepID=A0ABW0SEW2_9RHOB|nr:NAD(P)H-quinone oxidoreductase [Rubellimicrobium aerolatum]MBP1806521.1 putative PIG3 family NAD(P)H quinone oxidoreductase [Rubellimicrobium aerolatum]